MGSGKALDAIGEPRRRELLLLLQERGPMAVGELAELVAVSQQAVSQHLKVLQEALLVEARREGTRHIYAVRPEGFEPIRDFVAAFWDARLSALKGAVEEP